MQDFLCNFKFEYQSSKKTEIIDGFPCNNVYLRKWPNIGEHQNAYNSRILNSKIVDHTIQIDQIPDFEMSKVIKSIAMCKTAAFPGTSFS